MVIILGNHRCFAYSESMELFINILSESFTWGLLVGLLLVVTTWRLMRKDLKQLGVEKNRLETETEELQGHLNTQLKINSKGNEQLEKQLEDLREQNETLRMNLNVSNLKPGKAELRQMQIMDMAASMMREQAPGFAQAWEKALRDAENDFEAAEGGFKKLIRKVIPTSKKAQVVTIDNSTEE